VPCSVSMGNLEIQIFYIWLSSYFFIFILLFNKNSIYFNIGGQMKKRLILSSILLILFSCSIKTDISVPKTLLFSPINPEYLQDNAEKWKATGFDGFLLSGIMSNWADDIWAKDGDSLTRNEDDKTFQRIKKCNEECKKHGITENFIKVAFYKHVPLWTDDAAWKKIYNNFGEAARFAKNSYCRGIALDIEYVSEQYHLDWEGYDYLGYTKTDLREAAIKRGKELIASMLQNYPDMVFLNLPEGITFYGPLAGDFFLGMIQEMAENNAPGGIHLLTESTYDMTSTLGLIHYSQNLESKIFELLDDSSKKYWKEKCSIVPGGWPLGYYRKIVDKNGEFLGYSGKEEKFGNKVVGSYADKSSRFSVEEFRNQYAGLLLSSKKYCWIYGHGATWWQFTEAELKKYGKVGNSDLPVDERLDEYKTVLSEKWMGSPKIQATAGLIKQGDFEAYIRSMNFVKNFQVIGPFGCKDCNNFNKAFPPENEIEFMTESDSFSGKLKWQTLSIDKNTGYLDFTKYFKPKDWVCVYAFCKISCFKEQSAQIRLGTNDMGALWFNGEKILSQNIERSAVLDDDIIPVQLKKGENTILIKVCNTELNWGLYLRITDEKGNAISGLEFGIE